jgi:hypothetical protein
MVKHFEVLIYPPLSAGVLFAQSLVLGSPPACACPSILSSLVCSSARLLILLSSQLHPHIHSLPLLVFFSASFSSGWVGLLLRPEV